MWILILALAGTGITAVPDFRSRTSCEAAAVEAQKQRVSSTQVRAFCIQMKRDTD